MGKRDGRQKGAQRHAEGQHGEKAHSRFIESLHEGRPPSASELGTASKGGPERSREEREQHDEAERNSEKSRVERRGNPPAAK